MHRNNLHAKQKFIIMKKIKVAIATALAFAATTPLMAQNPTSYFIDSAIESKNHNAAFAPDRGYFNIPVVGGMTLSTNGSMAPGDILYSIDDTIYTMFDDEISPEQALAPLNAINTFGTDSRFNILGFGKYRKDMTSFWSFDLSLRNSVNISAPYELFELIKNEPDAGHISNTELYVDSYVEAAFGYSTKVTDRINVGARVKFLAGMGNATLNINHIDYDTNADGDMVVSAQGSIDINSNGTTINSENGEFILDDIEPDFLGPAGYGAAIDLGATYDLTENLQFSLAANDVGFILWNKKSNIRGTLNENYNLDEDDFELMIEDNGSRGSSKWLQANINAGAEYKLWGDRVGVGALYSAHLWRSEVQHNLTTALTFTPIRWFTLAASYAVTNNHANAVGFAANLATGFLNLYVATDILTSEKRDRYIPVDQNIMNVSFGLAVPMGKRGER